MSQNNQMIQKPKMGFWQRIRKAVLMRNINQVKYEKAPDELKVDMDIVIKLLVISPNSASILPHHLKVQAIEQQPSIFVNMPVIEQIAIVEIEPKYLSKMPEDRALAYIHRFGMTYAKYLPEALQERLLTEEVKVKNTIVNFSPEWTQRVMDSFSPNVVERLVERMSNSTNGEKATYKDKQAYEELFSNIPIGWMPLDMQRRLINIDSRFIDKTSEEGFAVLIQENPELIKSVNYHLNQISMLPNEIQLKLAQIDTRVICKMSKEALQSYVEGNPQALKQLDSDTQIQIVINHPEYEDILDEEQKNAMSQIINQPNQEETSEVVAESKNKNEESFAI